MTLDKAKELLTIQINMANGYNRNNKIQQLPLKVSDIYRRLTT